LGDQIEKNEIGRHVARNGERRGIYRVWWGNLKERARLEDLGIDGRILLRWIFRKWDGGHGLDSSGSGKGQVAGTCNCSNEPSSSIKCGKFLD
jgi:hypothetical protein